MLEFACDPTDEDVKREVRSELEGLVQYLLDMTNTTHEAACDKVANILASIKDKGAT